MSERPTNRDPLTCYPEEEHLWSVTTDACVLCGMPRLTYFLAKAVARALAHEWHEERGM